MVLDGIAKTTCVSGLRESSEIEAIEAAMSQSLKYVKQTVFTNGTISLFNTVSDLFISRCRQDPCCRIQPLGQYLINTKSRLI